MSLRAGRLAGPRGTVQPYPPSSPALISRTTPSAAASAASGERAAAIRATTALPTTTPSHRAPKVHACSGEAMPKPTASGDAGANEC